MTEPAEPDAKNWTWVLERRCPDCGLDAGTVPLTDVPRRLRENAAAWREVLRRRDVAVRPAPRTWSALEYGCHVRDVHEVFADRYALVLGQDDPVFADWDQDATAAAGDYPGQDAGAVAAALSLGAERVAVLLDGVPAAAAGRTARRSNGSPFTLTTLAQYHLHDVVHHAWDVGAT